MKKKTVKIKPGIFKYLLVLPFLALSFCQSEFEEPFAGSENRLTVDAKVLALMKSAIQSDSDQILTQNKGVLSKTTTEDDGQCTYFLYPMTFDVYAGDGSEIKEINSDEELIAFIETFTFEDSKVFASSSNYEMYVYFPITLLDTDGVETALYSLTELEGTLQMAVEACESFNNGSGEGLDGGSDDGSDDGSDGGSDDGSDGGSDDGSDDGSDNSSDDGSDDGSDGGSGDDTFADGNQSDDDDIEYEFCDKNNKKVYICHKGKTICVSVNAIWGHMEHHEEDFLGTCDD